MRLIEGHSLAYVIGQLRQMEKIGSVIDRHDLQEVLSDELATLATDLSSGEFCDFQAKQLAAQLPPLPRRVTF